MSSDIFENILFKSTYILCSWNKKDVEGYVRKVEGELF